MTDVARFTALYPGLYVNAAWPTTDRVIPWGLFAALSGEGSRVAALWRLLGAQAIAAGIGLAMSDKGREIAARLDDDAFPETRG